MTSTEVVVDRTTYTLKQFGKRGRGGGGGEVVSVPDPVHSSSEWITSPLCLSIVVIKSIRCCGELGLGPRLGVEVCGVT